MQGGEGTMRARWWPGLLLLSAILALGILEAAWGQTAPIPGLEKLTPEERAIAEKNFERWQKLTPEERARALENYRHWKSMTPEERQGGRANQQRFPPAP